MNGQHFLNRFQFNDDFAANHEVSPKALIKTHAVVNNWDGRLPFHLHQAVPRVLRRLRALETK